MDRYIGLDAHSQTCTLTVMGPTGRRLRELVVETNGAALVDAVRAIAGTRRLCIEEGAQSQWLYELLLSHVEELVVVQPNKHAGNKNDAIDAWALAEQLRVRASPKRRVFKSTELQSLRAAARAQRRAAEDLVRAKNRLRAVYRSRGLKASKEVYSPDQREAWNKKLPTPERMLAERFAWQLEAATEFYNSAKQWLAREAAKVPAVARLCLVPGLGPITAAQIVAVVIAPDRFRTKRQFWSYCGLGIVTRSSSDWIRSKDDRQWQRREVNQTRGLNRNRNPVLKSIFKNAAKAVLQMEHHPLRERYDRALEAGTKPNLARLTLARRIAAAALAVWKKKEVYDLAKHCGRAA